jgi:hypothetical protein
MYAHSYGKKKPTKQNVQQKGIIVIDTNIYDIYSYYQILVVHAVYMWSDDGEIFDALWGRGVWNVHGHSDIISDSSYLAFKRRRKCTFW